MNVVHFVRLGGRCFDARLLLLFLLSHAVCCQRATWADEPAPPSATGRIVLPSGNVLDVQAIFLSPVKDADFITVFPSGTTVFSLEFNSGRPWATVTHANGELNGAAVALYETGEVATMARYAKGDRHGNLLTWNPTGEKSLFAQFARGRLHGLLCLFQDDELWLVQEYAAGKLEASHIIADGAIAKSFMPEGDSRPADADIAGAHAALDELLESLAKKEVDFKKSVRQAEQQRRRVAAASKSAENRLRIQQRDAERRGTFDEAMSDLRRRMGL